MSWWTYKMYNWAMGKNAPAWLLDALHWLHERMPVWPVKWEDEEETG